MDGTLVGSNVVSYYAWLKMREMPAAARPLWAAAFLAKIPFYWALDKASRAHFNRAFYKNYAGWKPSRARHLGQESFPGFTLSRIYPDALTCLREHKRMGHRVVLLSGALDFLLDPFKDLADDVLSASLAEEDGVYTGELSGAPVAGEARARMLASFARKRGVDLGRSYAYADSISDRCSRRSGTRSPSIPTAGSPRRPGTGLAAPQVEQERLLPRQGLGCSPSATASPCHATCSCAPVRSASVVSGDEPVLALETGGDPEPRLPTPDWVRLKPLVSGICGSDLGTLSSENSPYFSPITSSPFVLGHEVVGVVTEDREIPPGERVVLEPALGCAVRGLEPPCAYCAAGQHALCVNVAKGDISPGIQTGFCRDTGGGWSEGTLVAHPSQLHRVPDDLPDEAAATIEPSPARSTRRSGTSRAPARRRSWSGPAQSASSSSRR